MGLFAELLNTFCEQCSTQSIYVLAGLAFLAFIMLSVVINVLAQLVFKDPNEPPMVFHWFPFIGSTISYGMDPYKFFFDCRAKVRVPLIRFGNCGPTDFNWLLAWRYFHIYFAGEKDNRLFGNQGQRFYPQCEAKRRVCRGSLLSFDDSCLWKARCLRLPKFETHGAEEGRGT